MYFNTYSISLPTTCTSIYLPISNQFPRPSNNTTLTAFVHDSKISQGRATVTTAPSPKTRLQGAGKAWRAGASAWLGAGQWRAVFFWKFCSKAAMGIGEKEERKTNFPGCRRRGAKPTTLRDAGLSGCVLNPQGERPRELQVCSVYY